METELIEDLSREESILPYLALITIELGIEPSQYQCLLYLAKVLSWSAIFWEASINENTSGTF
jgi:hypothetical protein